MKHTKKLASLLLALVLAFALAVPAFAADSYTITINNSVDGYTYTAYQIFKGDLAEESEKKVLSNIVWGTGVTSAGQSALLMFGKNEGEEPYASAAALAESLTQSNVADFAEEAGKYLGTTAGDSSFDNTKKLHTITVTAPGYYLIKNTSVPNGEVTDTTYTNYILEVVADTTVEHKGTFPTVDKNIGTVETIETKVNGADYNIGDDVPFTLTATLPDNLSTYETYKIIFHDTLDNGLTYNANSAKVYVINGATTTEAKAGYTVEPTGQTLTVTIADVNNLKDDNSTAITMTAASKIIVEYTAELNVRADIGTPGNKNTVYLEYSNDPNWDGTGSEPEPTGNTPKDEVLVFTYELDVTKVDGKDETKKLKDAEFVLYREVLKTVGEAQTKVKEYVTVDEAGKVIGWTENDHDSTETNKASVLKSDTNGSIKVIGLDAGTYYLEEIKAPSGYNKLSDPITIVITASVTTTEDAAALTGLTIKVGEGEAKSGVLDTGIVSTNVENNAGATLPETGGMGTTLFYVLGGVLVVGAVVLLITKKRMGAEQ